MATPNFFAGVALCVLFLTSGEGGGGYGFLPVAQRYDGHFNNMNNPAWGSAGRTLARNVTSQYADLTYMPSGPGRPNPRTLSQELFRGPSGLPSYNNRTALFAFFGQLVQWELTDTDDAACPVELLEVPVPRCDRDFDPHCRGDAFMPYQRVAYDTHTGQSPNNPRAQLNGASSYIDGSFVYGSSTVRCDLLREPKSGKLACQDQWGRFPVENSKRLPFVTFPTPSGRILSPTDLWVLGDTHVYENPGVLSLSVLWFRYHNHLADIFMHKTHTNLTTEQVFQKARRHVIAAMQKIIMYDWLPKLINRDIPPYTGYKPGVKSDITDLFDAVALPYIMTLIPPGIYRGTFRGSSCSFLNHEEHLAQRLCNTYWNSKELLYENMRGTEEYLLGMASQMAEREDTVVVEDLRSKFYGPLFHSRHDRVVLTLMKGRDYGLPDYRSARRQLGLGNISSWQDINPWLHQHHPELLVRAERVHRSLDDIDLFTGAMLETTDQGPGPLISSVFLDQMLKLRDGDRFWFENTEMGVFTEKELAVIRNLTLRDVMVNTTELELGSLQEDVFTLTPDAPCRQPVQLNESMLEQCPHHHGYNYFAGSEVPYIIIWVCIGVIPLACILAACILAKLKRWQYQRRMREAREEKERKRILRRALSSSLSVHDAVEWRGRAGSRNVELHLTSKGQLEVFSSTGAKLRNIQLTRMGTVQLWTSNNKRHDALLLHVPKEYDLVVHFGDEQARYEFETALGAFLANSNVQMLVEDRKLQEIYATAVTREKRNKMLEKFFKTVFSQAFQMDYDPALDEVHLDTRKGPRDILEIELSKDEFSEALAVNSSSNFVEHFFTLIDTDGNGYISFRELLHHVVIFSKGSYQEKLETLFHMYGPDGSGNLSKQEIRQMVRSLLELAQSTDLSSEAMDQLVNSLCAQAGLQSKEEFNFEDFCQILSPQMDILWNASLDWKGLKSWCPTPTKKTKRSPPRPRGLTRNCGSEPDLRNRPASLMAPAYGRRGSALTGRERDHFPAVREKYTPIKAKIKMVKHFIENYRQHIFFLVLFFGITVGLFAERFYFYTVEREHSGLRRVMSYGICVTRGAAASMSFTFSLLLLTMCRNSITYLRSTFVNLFIPFDSHVSFHKIAAWTALFFTGQHVVGYSFNFYHLATLPTSILCIFDSVVFRAEFLPTFTFWLFGNMTGFTGVLLVVVICVMYVFATQTARRHIFNMFWLTHKLFVVMYALTVLHGASVIVQKPMFFAYMVGPAILFTLDKMVSLSRKRTQITIIRAENLPSDVTMLEFKRPPNFEYKSGQWVRIACLPQGRDEYHPFTLTSSPHEDTLKVHIRALGPWTWNIRRTFDSENIKDGVYPKLYLDGPYGAGQQDWYQYEVSVLVGAGIGVTPYASILKDFVHMSSVKNTFKVKCQKLYFIWITGSQRHYEWLIDIMRQVEEIDQQGMVSIDIFITQFFQNFDLRTSLLYVFEEHFQKLSGGRSVFTGLKATTHFGRPELNKIMQCVQRANPRVKKVGVFSCGPPGVTKGVEHACMEASKTTKALFEHHYENF